MDLCHLVIIRAAAGGISLVWYLAPPSERVSLSACEDWPPRAPAPRVHLYRGRNHGGRVCGSGRAAGAIWGER
jgi:hypothetical protein